MILKQEKIKKIGVNPYAIVLPVKVRKSMIDNPDVVSEGIKWAVDHGADIINLSIGRKPTKNNNHHGYRKGVEHALKVGKLLIASAGTSGEEVFQPGAIEGVFTVGGLDANLKYQSNIDINGKNVKLINLDSAIEYITNKS